MTGFLLLSILLAVAVFGAGAWMSAHRSPRPTTRGAGATSLSVARVSLRSGVGDTSTPPASTPPAPGSPIADPRRRDRGRTWRGWAAHAREPAFELHLVLCHRWWASFGTLFRLREHRAEAKTKNAFFRALRSAEHGVRFRTYMKGGCVMRAASLAGPVFASALRADFDRRRVPDPMSWRARHPPRHQQSVQHSRLRC